MRFAALLGFVAASPGVGNRAASRQGPPKYQPTAPTHLDINFNLTEDVKVLTDHNHETCKKCVDYMGNFAEEWFWYSWKIDVGEKRLIVRCSSKQPAEKEGFEFIHSMKWTDKNTCDIQPALTIGPDNVIKPKPLATGVAGITLTFSHDSDRCVDFLDDCMKCVAMRTKDHSLPSFFWKYQVILLRRTLTECRPGHPTKNDGWEGSLPRIITKEWCQKWFNYECPAPPEPFQWKQQAPLATQPPTGGETQQPPTGGKAPTDGRGLFFWLKVLFVLVLVVAAAFAAGVYFATKKSADEGEGTKKSADKGEGESEK